MPIHSAYSTINSLLCALNPRVGNKANDMKEVFSGNLDFPEADFQRVQGYLKGALSDSEIQELHTALNTLHVEVPERLWKGDADFKLNLGIQDSRETLRQLFLSLDDLFKLEALADHDKAAQSTKLDFLLKVDDCRTSIAKIFKRLVDDGFSDKLEEFAKRFVPSLAESSSVKNLVADLPSSDSTNLSSGRANLSSDQRTLLCIASRLNQQLSQNGGNSGDYCVSSGSVVISSGGKLQVVPRNQVSKVLGENQVLRSKRGEVNQAPGESETGLVAAQREEVVQPRNDEVI